MNEQNIVIIFTISTFCGKVPSIVLEAFISYDVINIYQNYIKLIITIIAVILIVITIKRVKKGGS